MQLFERLLVSCSTVFSFFELMATFQSSALKSYGSALAIENVIPSVEITDPFSGAQFIIPAIFQRRLSIN